MDDLYYPEKRDRYYKQAHHIKQLMRKLQTTDDTGDVYDLYEEIVLNVAELAEIKFEDLDEYKSHMKKMLTDICERGN